MFPAKTILVLNNQTESACCAIGTRCTAHYLLCGTGAHKLLCTPNVFPLWSRFSLPVFLGKVKAVNGRAPAVVS